MLLFPFGCSSLLLEIGYVLADGQRRWTTSFPRGGHSRLHGRAGIFERLVVLKTNEMMNISMPMEASVTDRCRLEVPDHLILFFNWPPSSETSLMSNNNFDKECLTDIVYLVYIYSVFVMY